MVTRHSSFLESNAFISQAQLVSSTSQSQRKSRYISLSTSRLVALRNSKLQDLLRKNEWRFGDVSQGRKTLMFFVGLTGLSHDPDAKLDMLSLVRVEQFTHTLSDNKPGAKINLNASFQSSDNASPASSAPSSSCSSP